MAKPTAKLEKAPKLKIKKGDTVTVIAGSNKGKTGKVLKVLPKIMRVLVEGVNVKKRHTKPSSANPQGGIIPKEVPLHYSNLLISEAASPKKEGKATKAKTSKKAASAT